MDFKFIIGIIAAVLVIIGYVPYFRDVFKKKTKPHLYTWLIWGLTQGTAAVALIYGGGKFGSLALITGTILVSFIFMLSFKYGTKDIVTSDKVFLILALGAIIVWWQLDNPLIAVLLVSGIDGVGYIPTIRKTLNDPWSETLSFWVIMAVATFLIIIANAEYNFLTTFYISTLLILNMIVALVCFFKRRVMRRAEKG